MGCPACHGDGEEHLAKLSPELRSHTFRFLPPSTTGNRNRPSSCTSRCHPGRNAAWTAQTLEEWQGARIDPK